jgi:class 3 adenylate cyclase
MLEIYPDSHALHRASYVPAWVKRRLLGNPAPPSPAEHARIDAALLFADISGFTPLAERLAARGAEGAEELSRILNDYFGRLLALVDLHGGEPFKFAGDALMALWPARNGDLAEATHRASACSLAIQKSLHSYDAGNDTRLSLRVGVAAGQAVGVQLQAGDRWFFAVGGHPLTEVVYAQSQAQPGDAVVSASVWNTLSGRAAASPAGGNCWRLGLVDAAPRSRKASKARLTASALAKLEGYLPGPVRARLDAGHAEWLAELRKVTALFVHVDNLDHTTAAAPARLQTVVELARPIVERYQGYFKELAIDDKGIVLVVIFGLPPVAHEDDAVRGARAANDLNAALATAGHGGAAGVATGRCFCGVVGSDVRREYAVVGDTMNLAARLMGAAIRMPEAQRVICDAATRLACGERMEFEALPPITVKGKTEPIEIARPLAIRDRAARAAADLVGRKLELGAIADALQRTALGTGAGTLFILGDAGMGKSRLVQELCRLAPDAGVTALVGGADAIESGTPYFAWRKPFESLLGLEVIADAQERRDTVLHTLGPGLAGRAPLLEAVLALGFPDTADTARMTGAVRANATRELLLEILGRAAAGKPFAIVLEDAHWFDASSWLLALEASRRIGGLQLTLTSRPVEDPAPAELASIRSDPRCATLALEALAEDEILALVCRRLGADGLPPEIDALIRARAAGHPLYAEELAYALRDAGMIEVSAGSCRLKPGADLAGLALPDSVQGVVTARIGRLAPREELALKVASIIGVSFEVRALRDVHPVREDVARLDQSLRELRRADFTVLERPEPQAAYLFKHVLIREGAYNLMLFSQRRQLHQAVAQWYESVFGMGRPELLSVLAHHWARAGVVPKAVAYLEKSATRTFGMGLGKAAVDQGLEAARLLGVDLPTEKALILPLVGAELGRIQSQMAGRAPAELLAHKRLEDEPVGAIIGLLLRIMPYAHQSLQGELFALMALRCLSLTLEKGNGPAAPVVYAMNSIVYRVLTADARTSYEFAELALELDARNGRHLLGPVSFVYTWFNQHWVHPVARAFDMSLEASEVAFRAGDVQYGCFNLAAHVVQRAVAGRPLEEVVDVAARHLALNEGRVLNAAYHCVQELQFAKALAGRTTSPLSMTDAEHDEEREIASICATDNYNQIGFYFIARLRLHYYYGDLPVALDCAEKAASLLPAFAGQTGEIELALFHALALLAQARTLPASERAGAIERASGMHGQLCGWAANCESNFSHKALLIEAELARTQGRGAEALALYAKAAASAAEHGYIQHEALAHELRCASLREAGGDGWRQARDDARSAYSRWGARAKVADLETRYS